MYWGRIQNPQLAGKKKPNKQQKRSIWRSVWFNFWFFGALGVSGLRIATLVLTDKAPAYLAENFTPHLIPHTKLARQHIEQPSKRSSAVVDDTSNRKYLAALQALEEISKLNIPTITIEKVEACINDNHYQEVALQERKFRFLSLDDVVICNINLF
ncbi:MAG: hypothetical protein MJK04_23190, partial [Psychrosphaera sp.]|nr:hypothetical protein [Psychrosphaera sp.]